MSDSSAPENTPAPETPDISALNKRLEGAQTQLDSLRRGVKRSAIISTCIGVVLLLLLTGYFTYGYLQILNFVNKPEEAVSLVGQTVEDMLPDARKQLETMIVNDSPAWAERASEELVANAPKIREQLEALIFEQTEQLVETLAGFTAKEFEQFLVDQRPMLEAEIRELSSANTVPEKTMAELTQALENNLQVNIQEQADELLKTVRALNDKLSALSEGRDLTREESYMRRAMMILRRVQLEQQDPDFVGKKWTIASKPDPTSVEETPDKPDEKPNPEPAKETKSAEKTSASEAKKEAKPTAKTPPAKAQEKAELKVETPAPDAKEAAEPKAETTASKAKRKAKAKAEATAPKATETEPKAKKAAAAPEKANAGNPKPE